MKKFYTFLVLVFTIFVGNAQIVNIPDAAFKSFLLAADTTNLNATDALDNAIKIDINNDGEIQTSEALAVYNLYPNIPAIADLTGITSFTNMRELGCNSTNYYFFKFKRIE